MSCILNAGECIIHLGRVLQVDFDQGFAVCSGEASAGHSPVALLEGTYDLPAQKA